MTGPAIPRITGGEELRVSQRRQLLVDCPKCKRNLDITDVRALAPISCPECENVTWAPEYVPKWWQRLRNFVLSNVVAFLVGVAASLVATSLWERSKDAAPAQTTSTSGVTNVN
jgi:hypothetical protein